MARKVYFAFDYQDVFEVNQIRRSGEFVGVAVAGFADASQWETLKLKSDDSIRSAIDAALVGTSVTAVCVGARTASRRWVQYELRASIARGNGLLGVFLPGQSGHPKPELLGAAPLRNWNSARFGAWVEEAAAAAGR
jgi:hypothetical protein